MKNKLLISLVIGGLLVVGVVIGQAQSDQENLDNLPYPTSCPDTLSLKYYFPNQFQQSIKIGETLAEQFPEKAITAGVIPHDITHGEYIAHFFFQLKNQKPKNILLIGPNHFELGNSPITTSAASWSTPFGKLQTSQKSISTLLQQPAITENAQIIQNEHSIAGMVPFIAYYLPEVNIIPLIFKSELTLQDINYLAKALDNSLPKDTILIAAVDFSHYLTSDEAERNDKITEKALQELDYHTILSFGPRFNDYLDSPPSIALLLNWLEKNNIQNNKILYHTNSGMLTQNFSEPTTSYFEMVYY